MNGRRVEASSRPVHEPMSVNARARSRTDDGVRGRVVDGGREQGDGGVSPAQQAGRSCFGRGPAGSIFVRTGVRLRLRILFVNGLTWWMCGGSLGRGLVLFGLVRRVAEGSSVIHDEGNNCLDQGPLVPSPRASSDAGRVRVVGVESEPLTEEQATAAIRALSGLIVSYWEATNASETMTDNRSSEACTA